MSKKITNYYVLCQSKDFVLENEFAPIKGKTKFLAKEADKALVEIMEVGFADWVRHNKLYQQVLENLSVFNMTIYEMYNQLVQTREQEPRAIIDHNCHHISNDKQGDIDEVTMETVAKLRL